MREDKLFKEGYSEHLQRERLKQGLTLREVANKTSVTYETVRQVMRGGAGSGAVFDVAIALGVNVKDLLKESVLKGA